MNIFSFQKFADRYYSIDVPETVNWLLVICKNVFDKISEN